MDNYKYFTVFARFLWRPVPVRYRCSCTKRASVCGVYVCECVGVVPIRIYYHFASRLNFNGLSGESECVCVCRKVYNVLWSPFLGSRFVIMGFDCFVSLPVCQSMWLVKCSLRLKLLPQISQRNGVSLVWERIWLARCSLRVYFLPQTSHWCGVWPVWLVVGNTQRENRERTEKKV